MSRRKRGSRPPFMQIDSAVYTSEAWRALPDAALRLWIDLRALHNGKNNGQIAPTFSKLRPLGWTSNDKLERALDSLVAHGFIAYTRKTGPNVFHRAARVRFTDLPCPGDEALGIDGCGPTMEYRNWRAGDPSFRNPRFAVPGKRGGTAPGDGKQPPRQTGNASPEPPRQTGNAESRTFHRENAATGDVARRSPGDGEDIDIAIPTGKAEATSEADKPIPAGSLILRDDEPLRARIREYDRKRAAAKRAAAKGAT